MEKDKWYENPHLRRQPDEAAAQRDDQSPDVSRTTGTNNTTHDAGNVGGSEAEHINRAGDSIAGRTSNTGIPGADKKSPSGLDR